jgi:hypothetical protein
MSIEWYIGFDGQVVGPVDQQQLLDFLKSSEQWRQILVWHTGLDDWKLAKDVQDIASQVSKGPPPLPAPLLPPPAPPKAEAPSIVPAEPVAETKPTKPTNPAPVAPPNEQTAKPIEPVAATSEPVAQPVAATPAPETERIDLLVAQAAPEVTAVAAPTAPRARRRWGWGATALTILLLLGGAFAAQQLSRKDAATVAKATQPSTDAVIERGFAEIVQATALPKKLDDYTTRFDMTPAGKRLVFHHIVDTTRYLVPQNFAAATKEKMLPEACTTAAREALKVGATLEYRFHTQAAFLIGSFEITGNDCGSGQVKG